MSEDLRSPTVVAIEVANKELATIQEKILAAGRKSDERKELKAKAENLEADIERLRAELATERDSAPEEATADPTGPNETEAAAVTTETAEEKAKVAEWAARFARRPLVILFLLSPRRPSCTCATPRSASG